MLMNCKLNSFCLIVFCFSMDSHFLKRLQKSGKKVKIFNFFSWYELKYLLK